MDIMLENCPCCGSVSGFVGIEKEEYTYVRVQCASCGLGTMIVGTRTEAAERWNRRVLPTCAGCGDTRVLDDCILCEVCGE